eukprot:TRINITY_DN4159_c0_g1_i1.p1 TRINITY_DN4159_c0_g1~~TRINITY_DN4159_c0_g1_i1.p1  ORF type:complete len:330 (-),score=22.39 TRINITY_DN4159_c0_g1_i1:165-1046(-)
MSSSKLLGNIMKINLGTSTIFPKTFIRISPSKMKLLQRNASTMNKEEVDKFSKMAADWWNPEGVCKPLHSMNKVRVPFVRDRILMHNKPTMSSGAEPLKGLKILDVGCGGGILSEPLARLGANVTAVDACKENIEIAKLHSSKQKLTKEINYQCITVEEFAESCNDESDKFDAIVASEIIEHVDNPQLFISSMSTLLKDGGSLFITTLNRTTRSWVVAIVGAEYIVGLLPKGTHDWNKFLKPEEIEEMCDAAGLGTRLVNGLTYIPVMNQWIWIPDKSVNFALHAVKYEQEKK